MVKSPFSLKSSQEGCRICFSASPGIWPIRKAKGSLSCLLNTVSKLCHMEPSDLCWVPKGEKAQTDLIPML